MSKLPLYTIKWGLVCHYIPQVLWDVITCPCPSYLLPTHESSNWMALILFIKYWGLQPRDISNIKINIFSCWSIYSQKHQHFSDIQIQNDIWSNKALNQSSPFTCYESRSRSDRPRMTNQWKYARDPLIHLVWSTGGIVCLWQPVYTCVQRVRVLILLFHYYPLVFQNPDWSEGQ